jgi:hypothetical protein
MQPIAVLHASQSWPPFKVANWSPLQQSISAAPRKRRDGDGREKPTTSVTAVGMIKEDFAGS